MGSILSIFEKQESVSQAGNIPIRHRPTTLSSAFEEQLDADIEKGTTDKGGAQISVGVGQN